MCCSITGRRLHALSRPNVPRDAIPASECPYFYALKDDGISRCLFASPESCDLIPLPEDATKIKSVRGSCLNTFILSPDTLWRRADGHWSSVYLRHMPIDVLTHREALYGLFADGIHQIFNNGSTALRAMLGKLHISESVFGNSKAERFYLQSTIACGSNVFVLMNSRPEERTAHVLRLSDAHTWNSVNHTHETVFKFTAKDMQNAKLACIDGTVQVTGIDNIDAYK